MKKALLILLVASLLLTASACSGKEQKTTETLEETTPVDTGLSDQEALASFFAKFKAGEYKVKIFDYEDYEEFVELGEYKGLEYPDSEELHPKVTDEKVNDYITGIQLTALIPDEDFITVKEGTVRKFDTVVMDYRGVIEGEAFEGGSAEDQTLLIGKGDFIPGFEEGLIGAEIGKEVRLDLKFSPYYGSADIAGKDVSFYVTVKEVSRVETIPEVTVEEFNKFYGVFYGTTFESMEEVWNDIHGYLERQEEDRVNSLIVGYLEQRIIENSIIKKYPDKEMEYMRNVYTAYSTQDKDPDVSVEEYCEETLGITYEEFLEDAEEYARKYVAEELVIRALIQKEAVEVTEEQMEALIVGMYQSDGAYYADLESFIADCVETYGGDVFWRQIAGNMVIETITESAVVQGE